MPDGRAVEIGLLTRYISTMTRSQFAMAVLADEKWVENAGRLMDRRFRYTAEEARWLGLVRVLNQEVGVTLSRAAELADEALRHAPDEGSVIVGRAGGSAGVSIDLARFHSTYAAALSAALDMGGARRRGRPRAILPQKARALDRAAQYGVDLDLLREGLRLSPRERLQRLDDNAAFVNAIRPVRKSPRPQQHELP
jgi:hypothetical protein